MVAVALEMAEHGNAQTGGDVFGEESERSNESDMDLVSIGESVVESSDLTWLGFQRG